MEISFYLKEENLEKVFVKIKSDAEKGGIKIEGTMEKGNFHAFSTEGNYRFEDNIFKISVQKKPAYISDYQIIESLKEYFK